MRKVFKKIIEELKKEGFPADERQIFIQGKAD